ncbi:MAG: hypothetical protein Q8S53_12255 [Brevundimonas sp.]|uniref:hypothetical protein n=1 Tax=Brevundimonas sp. TaxID=1871086 RepID=UPI0027364E99|nr:hypothetical protein [Brevundimonas sp.]MDP3379126.1 hypothetical protein [Brevundimonas sp.]
MTHSVLTPLSLALAGSLLALGACAPTAPSGDATPFNDQTCFSPSQVRGFTKGSGQTVYLNVGRDSYELTVFGACTGLDSSLGFALEPDAVGITRLCPGDSTRIAVRGNVSPVEYCSARVGPRLEGRR